MEIRKITETSDKVGIHLCDDGKAIIIDGTGFCFAKTDTGIIIVKGDKVTAKETLKELGRSDLTIKTI